jgi:hypothetical protein
VKRRRSSAVALDNGTVRIIDRRALERIAE